MLVGRKNNAEMCSLNIIRHLCIVLLALLMTSGKLVLYIYQNLHITRTLPKLRV